jgi:hypothetical protein
MLNHFPFTRTRGNIVRTLLPCVVGDRSCVKRLTDGIRHSLQEFSRPADITNEANVVIHTLPKLDGRRAGGVPAGQRSAFP